MVHLETDALMSIPKALSWLADHNIPLPADLHLSLEQKGLLKDYKRQGMKQADSTEAVNKEYHDAITESLTGYFEEDGRATSYKSQFKQAMVEAFGSVYDLGWTDGGGELPVDSDALDWLNARIDQEFGFIDMLFQEAKELRKEEEFDFFSWVTFHADNYTRTLREIYNQARLRVSEDVMVTFEGEDGEESCPTCQKLKGVRHKISWFVKRNYVPPFGSGLECGRGGRCQHGLFDDKGEQITI